MSLTQSNSNQFPSAAAIRRDPQAAEESFCHLSHSYLTEKIGDLRSQVTGLENYPEAIHPLDVIVDSDLSLLEAFSRLSEHCPDEILRYQELKNVYYFGEDGKLHRGQVVIHEALSSDVDDLFKLIRELRIPLHSVIPLADERFQASEDLWSDRMSMQANNASAFNYRIIASTSGKLSLHALGLALDLNPARNPCFEDPAVLIENAQGRELAAGYTTKAPENGAYDPQMPGTFTERHPVVELLERLGWTWGGRWAVPLDLHHFQKIPAELEDWVSEVRTPGK